MTDADGNPFVYPYFIHDSYDSSDIINRFDWEKATDAEKYPVNNVTRDYTAGLIELRRSSDAFRLGSRELVDSNVIMVDAPEIKEQDLVVAYRSVSTAGVEYYTFVNADTSSRTLTLGQDLTEGVVVVDAEEANVAGVAEPAGFELTAEGITLEPLTTVVVRVGEQEGTDPDDGDGDGNTPPPGDGDGDGNTPPPGDGDGDGNTPPPGNGNGNNPGTPPGKGGENPGKGKNDKTPPGKGGENPGKGNKLPLTATGTLNYILFGAVMLVLGTLLYLGVRRKAGLKEKTL